MVIVASSAPGNMVCCIYFIQSVLNNMLVHDFLCECVKGGHQSDRKKKGISQCTEINVFTF